jgi:hypothetical protein
MIFIPHFRDGLFDFWEPRVTVDWQHCCQPVCGMMEEDLYRIVYVSTATPLCNDAVLRDILKDSPQHNAAVGITGLLLYKDGQFMQVLEGPEQAVKKMFEHIRQQPEHHGIMVLIEEHTHERQFTDWSMAFENLDLPPGQSRPGYSEFLNTPLTEAEFASNPSRCKKLLLLFKKNIR